MSQEEGPWTRILRLRSDSIYKRGSVLPPATSVTSVTMSENATIRKVENSAYRNWVFTLNNYTENELRTIANPYEEVKYIAYGKEVGEKGGVPHLQGFICMWSPVRLSWFKKFINRAHVEPMYGRLQDNEKYCSKQDSLTHIGERPVQGRRTDLISVKRKLDQGCRTMDLAEEETFFGTIAKHDRFFTKYEQHVRGKRLKTDREPPKVYIRYGVAGSGKTRWLDEQFGLDGWVQAPDNSGRWFDGCDRDVIVFDDVEAGSIPPLSLWKRLTDRYPMQVPVKGGFIVWKPRVIVFTSNTHPSKWWPGIKKPDWDAVMRRVTEIVFKEPPLLDQDASVRPEEEGVKPIREIREALEEIIQHVVQEEEDSEE